MGLLETVAAWQPIRTMRFHLYEERRVFGGARLPGGRWLEVGAGAGIGAAKLLRDASPSEVTVTDVDPRPLRAARRRLSRYGDRVRILATDARDLPFAGGHFDGCLSLLALHHVPDWRRGVAEVARVLRPGGVFLLEEFVGPSFWTRFHFRGDPALAVFSLDALVNGLEAAGLSVVRSTPLLWGVALEARKAADVP